MTHNGAIENDLGSNDYIATCDCGWEGPVCDSWKGAEAQLIKHYDEVSL